MLLIIGRHYDYDKEAGAGLKHMLYLKHTVEGASVKSLQTFIDHVTYLDGLVSERERPTADTFFQWFFGQVRKLPCVHKVVDLLRESRRHSRRRTYQWLFKKITVFLRERCEEANFESEFKGLSDGPAKPKTPGMPAISGGTHDQPPLGAGKRQPKQKQEQAPAETVPGAPATTKGKGCREIQDPL